MNCPKCDADTIVVDSRAVTSGSNYKTAGTRSMLGHKTVRRRRECKAPECRHRFSTYEVESTNTMLETVIHLETLITALVDGLLARVAQHRGRELDATRVLLGATREDLDAILGVPQWWHDHVRVDHLGMSVTSYFTALNCLRRFMENQGSKVSYDANFKTFPLKSEPESGTSPQ